MLAAVIAEGVAVALLGLLVAGLLRSHADILRALHELGASLDPGRPEPGSARRGPQPISLAPVPGAGPAHDLVGETLDGADAAVAVAGTRHDTLLAFLSTGCHTCQPFWTAFADGAAGLPEAARLVVVVQTEESESALRRLAAPGLTVVRCSAAWEAYQVPGSPHFVYVDGPRARVVGEGTASTWPQVLDLLGQARADAAARHQPAPDPRDNAERIDLELAAAGIGPGHPSLFTSPEPGARPTAGRPA